MPHLSDVELASLAATAVGKRLTVRLGNRSTDPEGSSGLRDIVGTLESVTPAATDSAGMLLLRRRDGTLARANVEDIHLVKVIGETANRLRTADQVTVPELAQIAAAGWRPSESAAIGDWVLRAAKGFTRRANSVLPLGQPGLPLDEAIACVTSWYADRGLTPQFQVPLPWYGALDEDLHQRRWVAAGSTSVMVADISDLLNSTPVKDDLPSVELTAMPNAAWMLASSYRNEPLVEVARQVMLDTDHPVFAGVPERESADDLYVAVARGTITGQWLGVTSVRVVPRARRRGWATHVLSALVALAASRGVRHVYLQIEQENVPAHALYRRLGFRVHHGYHYRRDGRQPAVVS